MSVDPGLSPVGSVLFGSHAVVPYKKPAAIYRLNLFGPVLYGSPIRGLHTKFLFRLAPCFPGPASYIETRRLAPNNAVHASIYRNGVWWTRMKRCQVLYIEWNADPYNSQHGCQGGDGAGTVKHGPVPYTSTFPVHHCTHFNLQKGIILLVKRIIHAEIHIFV